jgi:hypothetical protein
MILLKDGFAERRFCLEKGFQSGTEFTDVNLLFKHLLKAVELF